MKVNSLSRFLLSQSLNPRRKYPLDMTQWGKSILEVEPIEVFLEVEFHGGLSFQVG